MNCESVPDSNGPSESHSSTAAFVVIDPAADADFKVSNDLLPKTIQPSKAETSSKREVEKLAPPRANWTNYGYLIRVKPPEATSNDSSFFLLTGLGGRPMLTMLGMLGGTVVDVTAQSYSSHRK